MDEKPGAGLLRADGGHSPRVGTAPESGTRSGYGAARTVRVSGQRAPTPLVAASLQGTAAFMAHCAKHRHPASAKAVVQANTDARNHQPVPDGCITRRALIDPLAPAA